MKSHSDEASVESGVPAILLAGGLGTRLRSVDATRPKPMVLVHGKPFLYWLIRHLGENGYTRFILSIGYMASAIAEYPWKKDFPRLDFEFSVEGSPLGTGGAVKKTFETFKLSSAWVFNGDTLLEKPLPRSTPVTGDDVHYACLPRHAIFDAQPNVLTKGTRIVKVGSLSEKEILEAGAFPETQAQCLFDAGQVYVNGATVSAHQGDPPYALHTLAQKAFSKGSAGFTVLEGLCYDIGTPERLQRFASFVSQKPSPSR